MEVEPRFKEESTCPCKEAKCPRVGLLLKHTYKDRTRHIKGCPCVQCRGRKNRRSGLSAQRTGAKMLNVPKVGPFRPGNEEQWDSEYCRFEIKSGLIVRPLRTAFGKAEAQSEVARAIGDNRVFIMGALEKPEGKEMVVSLRARGIDDLKTKVIALGLHLGAIE